MQLAIKTSILFPGVSTFGSQFTSQSAVACAVLAREAFAAAPVVLYPIELTVEPRIE